MKQRLKEWLNMRIGAEKPKDAMEAHQLAKHYYHLARRQRMFGTDHVENMTMAKKFFEQYKELKRSGDFSDNDSLEEVDVDREIEDFDEDINEAGYERPELKARARHIARKSSKLRGRESVSSKTTTRFKQRHGGKTTPTRAAGEGVPRSTGARGDKRALGGQGAMLQDLHNMSEEEFRRKYRKSKSAARTKLRNEETRFEYDSNLAEVPEPLTPAQYKREKTRNQEAQVKINQVRRQRKVIDVKKFNYGKKAEEHLPENSITVSMHKSGTKYKVHGVHKSIKGQIKPGEHLSDTHIDDLRDSGIKIRHVKPKPTPKTAKPAVMGYRKEEEQKSSIDTPLKHKRSWNPKTHKLIVKKKGRGVKVVPKSHPGMEAESVVEYEEVDHEKHIEAGRTYYPHEVPVTAKDPSGHDPVHSKKLQSALAHSSEKYKVNYSHGGGNHSSDIQGKKPPHAKPDVTHHIEHGDNEVSGYTVHHDGAAAKDPKLHHKAMQVEGIVTHYNESGMSRVAYQKQSGEKGSGVKTFKKKPPPKKVKEYGVEKERELAAKGDRYEEVEPVEDGFKAKYHEPPSAHDKLKRGAELLQKVDPKTGLTPRERHKVTSPEYAAMLKRHGERKKNRLRGKVNEHAPEVVEYTPYAYDYNRKAWEESLAEVNRYKGRSGHRVTKPEKEEPEHIIMQMRKVQSLKKNHSGVEFNDGTKVKINPGHAQQVLNRHDSAEKSSDKESIARTAAHSHDGLKHVASGKEIDHKSPGAPKKPMFKAAARRDPLRGVSHPDDE